MARPSEAYLMSIVHSIIEEAEEDMAYYLGHFPEDQAEWEWENRLTERILLILNDMLDEKWPKDE
jgi:hypothetical protein